MRSRLLLLGLAMACDGEAHDDDALLEPPDPRLVTRIGTVSLSPNYQGVLYASASFRDPALIESYTLIEHRGACVVYQRAALLPECARDVEGQCVARVFAGDITLSNITDDVVTLATTAWPEDPDHRFYESASVDGAWAVAPFTVSAPGADLPGFNGVIAGLATPLGEIRGVPEDEFGQRVLMVRPEDDGAWDLRWTPAGDGSEVLFTTAIGGHLQPAVMLLQCRADDAAGHLHVPAKALRPLRDVPKCCWGISLGASFARGHRTFVETSAGPILLESADSIGIGVRYY